ncbi:chaperone-binding protein [Colletotrichum karsti]|uniref:Chaperone-binding protein n=1 Tax=Colletotrichum karsti TaxID=1095194 RepID=A0A9P6IE68_9PEZI|nr:chaperone-binding protein [Colletotrichum karsti]KAF9881209.1 chaperone-binding protein [Colletotrichum karsti]
MFGNMDFDPEHVPGVKLGLHIFQFILSFVIWALEIAVFRADNAKIVGNNGWTFGVCFLSIPAWIYLIMAPRWPRTRKLANPYAMVAVDGVFTIFWLSAFASQAAYNTANQCGDGCTLSKVIVGLGVFVTVLFGVTTFVSLYTLKHYQFHGSLPGYDKQKIAGDNIDPDKAAFSMAPHDEEAYAPVNMDDHNDEHTFGNGNASNVGSYSDRYGNNSAYGGASTAYGQEDDDPNRYGSLPSRQNAAMFDSETEYHSQRPTSTAPVADPYSAPVADPYSAPAVQPYAAPAYDDDRPAQFPAGNYDRTLR